MKPRVILVGPPRAGKSTYARALRDTGVPTYCTDPLSLVKDPEEETTYLPEGMDWSESSRFVADHWLTMAGPFCIEGVGTVRALRKLLDDGRGHILHGAKIVRFENQYEDAITKEGQRTMAKAIDSIWAEIAHAFPGAEYR